MHEAFTFLNLKNLKEAQRQGLIVVHKGPQGIHFSKLSEQTNFVESVCRLGSNVVSGFAVDPSLPGRIYVTTDKQEILIVDAKIDNSANSIECDVVGKFSSSLSEAAVRALKTLLVLQGADGVVEAFNITDAQSYIAFPEGLRFTPEYELANVSRAAELSRPKIEEIKTQTGHFVLLRHPTHAGKLLVLEVVIPKADTSSWSDVLLLRLPLILLAVGLVGAYQIYKRRKTEPESEETPSTGKFAGSGGRGGSRAESKEPAWERQMNMFE